MSRQRRRLRALRRAAFDRQHGLCWYCQRPMWDRSHESRAKANSRLGLIGAHRGRAILDTMIATAEHLVRRADGGRATEENIVAACAWCNSWRGDRDPFTWLREIAALSRKAASPAFRADRALKSQQSTSPAIEKEKAVTEFPTDPKALMDEAQAAKLTGLAVATLQTLRVRGGGPTFAKLGSSVRYRRGDLDAWVEERLSASTNGERRRK